MKIEEIHSLLAEKFGAAIKSLETGKKDCWIEVSAESIEPIAQFVKNDPRLAFDALNDLTAVDYLEPDPKKKDPAQPRLEMVYHLYSYSQKHWLVLKATLPRWKDGIAVQLPEIATVSRVWAIADWHEREAYDLMGISFLGHPNQRRILCAEDWEGHPLRKDYEFPLEYQGVRCK